jgi:preprotein translocase subunit SecY
MTLSISLAGRTADNGRGRELATRVAVTLGALAIYRLGAALPLPGVGAAALHGRGFRAIDLASVVTLGVVPLISALMYVEIARLLSRRFNDWAAIPVNARRINRWALAGALLMAALQAYGIAVGIEGFPGAVANPGPEFRLAAVTTLVGGTAVLAWLAALISRYGVGSGLWVVAITPWLASLPASVGELAEFARRGVLSQTSFVSILTYVFVTVVSAAALGLVLARRGMPLERVLIWPLYIGAFLANFILAVPLLLPAGPLQDTAAALLGLMSPLYLAALAAVTIAVSLAQSQRAEPNPPRETPAAGESSATPVDAAAAAPIAPVVLTALALAAVAVGPHLLVARFDVPIWISGAQMIVAVGIILGMKSLLPAYGA